MKPVLHLNGKVYEQGTILDERLGISKMTRTRWVKLGKLPRPLVLGVKQYFNRREVERHLLIQAQ